MGNNLDLSKTLAYHTLQGHRIELTFKDLKGFSNFPKLPKDKDIEKQFQLWLSKVLPHQIQGQTRCSPTCPTQGSPPQVQVPSLRPPRTKNAGIPQGRTAPAPHTQRLPPRHRPPHQGPQPAPPPRFPSRPTSPSSPRFFVESRVLPPKGRAPPRKANSPLPR